MIRQVDTVKTFHIVISGFLQYEGKPNGMIRLWRDLYRRHAGSNTMVLLRAWNDDVAALAELIWRLAARDVQVKIYGYSWGGAASVRLARQLHMRGIDVAAMVLTDAVYRHSYWLGNWRAFVRRSKLRIPCNVKIVHWFFQFDKWWKISGHHVVTNSPDITRVFEYPEARVSHTYMDDLPAFHSVSHTVANCYYNKGVINEE